MYSRRAVVALAFSFATLLNHVNACRCLARELCDIFETAEIVLRATVLSSTGWDSTIYATTYTLESTEVFKGEIDDAEYAEGMTFEVVTGSSAACGVNLAIGEEYLIDPQYSAGDGQFYVNSCGLTQGWTSLTEDDVALLDAGCEDDPCDAACGEFQECLLYTSSSTEEYYCADTCDPSPCDEGQECSLEQVNYCFRAPCPQSAVCSDPDPCD